MTPPVRVYSQWWYEVRRICPTCGAHLQHVEIDVHRNGPCGWKSLIYYRPIVYHICPVCNAEHVPGSPGADEDRCTACGCIMEGE